MTSSRVWGLCRGPGGDAGEGWRVMVKRERGGKQTGTDWTIGVGVKVSGSEQRVRQNDGCGERANGPQANGRVSEARQQGRVAG